MTNETLKAWLRDNMLKTFERDEIDLASAFKKVLNELRSRVSRAFNEQRVKMEETCSVPNCDRLADYDSPGVWCSKHWTTWWNWPYEVERASWLPEGENGDSTLLFREVGEGEELFSWEDFVWNCQSGVLTDDDGYGELSVKDYCSNIQISPNEISLINRPAWATHVVWYDK